MQNRIYEILKFIIGWPLSILAFFFIIKLIAPQAPKLLSQIHQISLPLLFCSLLFFLIYHFIRGYIWKILIAQTGYNISFKDTNFIWASSELKRYIPGNIWSFLGRAVNFTQKGVTKKDIIRCTIIEVELFILGAAIISLLALPFIAHIFSLPQNTNLIATLLLSAVILVYIFHKYLKLEHFILPTQKPTEIIFLFFLNTLMYLFFGLGYYFSFISFIYIDPNLIWQLAGFAALSFLVGYLSILTPSGFGVREGILFLGLSKIMATGPAGFLALFSRFILITAELIFVGLSYLWYTTKNKAILKLEKWAREHKQEIILLGLLLIYICYFTTVTFLRYDNFYAGRFDLGNMSQTVWNTTKGRIFTMTDANGTEIISRLSAHADFILILFAPLYALWPDPRNLLFLQTLILAAGAFFVYLIAKEILKSKNLSLVFAFAYLINPSIERANLYDFHAVTLATTFLLGAFYFFIKKKYWPFLVFSILAGLCKEQIWLIISLFGLFLFFQYKKRILGIILFISCVLLTFFLISYAIPHALGSKHFALSYYSDFGDSPIKIVKTIIFSPQKTFSIILQPDRIAYLKQLFSPLGYLSLLSPVFLIFAMPDLIIDLLSNNTQLHQIYYQYTATISPFIFISAIFSVALLKRLLTKQYVNTLFLCFILFTSLYTAFNFGPLPGSREPNLDMLTKPVANRAFIENYLSQIKKRHSVASSNNIGSHLSQRQKIYTLPLGIDKADVIVFLLNNSEFHQSLATEKELVKKLKLNPQYTLTVEKGEFIVFIKK
ncbi:DUF2079 domain-containing protein [Candidatus Roizmanbacteria bacterium]|nr:DUF2079 domain-containing protein [Candidatus Roizmanbacteria bacterium]